MYAESYMIKNFFIIILGIIACIGVLFLGVVIQLKIAGNSLDRVKNNLTNNNVLWLVANMKDLDLNHETTLKLREISSNIEKSTTISLNVKEQFKLVMNKRDRKIYEEWKKR